MVAFRIWVVILMELYPFTYNTKVINVKVTIHSIIRMYVQMYLVYSYSFYQIGHLVITLSDTILGITQSDTILIYDSR